MFSNFTISLLLGIGAGGWIYSKIDRKTGHNNVTSITVAAISAVVIMLILSIILDALFKHTTKSTL
jgi:uncharacterized membrane protein YeaQ/YmgE (transglycosylase-associated protein family)